MNIFTKLLVPRTFRIRHEILEFLSQNWNKTKHPSQRDLNVSKVSLFEKFKDIDKSELQNHLDILLKNEEIFSEVGVDQKLAYHTVYKGLDLYLTKEYLVKGKHERLNGWYDILKILGALIVIASFVRSIYLEGQNKTDIQNMEYRLNKVEKHFPVRQSL